jgi:hypothetical protein
MSLFSSIGKIVGGATTAVAKTAARAVAVTPLIAANLIAKDAPIVKKATALYDSKNAIKDAGTTASVASLIGAGGAIKTAITAGSSKLLGTKLAGYALTGATGSSMTLAPEKSEKVIKNLPKATKNIIDVIAENPQKSIAVATLAPIVAYGTLKTGGAAVNLASNLFGGRSDINNVTEVIGKVDKSNELLSLPQKEPEVKSVIDNTILSSGTSTILSPGGTTAASLTPTNEMTPILSKKRYKRRKAKQPMKISQNVKIAIASSNRNVYKCQSVC